MTYSSQKTDCALLLAIVDNNTISVSRENLIELCRRTLRIYDTLSEKDRSSFQRNLEKVQIILHEIGPGE